MFPFMPVDPIAVARYWALYFSGYNNFSVNAGLARPVSGPRPAVDNR